MAAPEQSSPIYYSSTLPLVPKNASRTLATVTSATFGRTTLEQRPGLMLELLLDTGKPATLTLDKQEDFDGLFRDYALYKADELVNKHVIAYLHEGKMVGVSKYSQQS